MTRDRQSGDLAAAPRGRNELEAAFLANRDRLLSFLRARGAGAAAEDMLHDIWLRLSRMQHDDDDQIRSASAYLMRVANSVVIDRHRQQRKNAQREANWVDANGAAWSDGSDEPAADRALAARREVDHVLAVLQAEGNRVYRIFCRHRIDGLTQREVAAEFGLSVGTIENDLRRAYAALVRFRAAEDKV